MLLYAAFYVEIEPKHMFEAKHDLCFMCFMLNVDLNSGVRTVTLSLGCFKNNMIYCLKTSIE